MYRGSGHDYTYELKEGIDDLDVNSNCYLNVRMNHAWVSFVLSVASLLYMPEMEIAEEVRCEDPCP